MPRLFEDDDQDSDFEIKPNTEYATHYNTWRQKEELNKRMYVPPNLTLYCQIYIFQ